MAITPEQIGRSLRLARESRKITQEEAATALGVQVSAISRMETGQRQVSTLELTRLAAFYGRPIEWFVRPASATDPPDPIIALFRAEPGLQSEVVREQARRCLRLLGEGAKLRRLTGASTEVSLPRYELPAPRSAGHAIAQGQQVAEQERRRLQLGQAPVKVPETMARQNVWTAALALPDEISGLFLRSPDFGMAILANRSQAPVRRRFSFAHEHGHALMDRDAPATATSVHNAGERTEQRANAFAAAFLMPEEGVREFMHSLGKGRIVRREEAAVDAVTEEGIEGQTRSPSGSQKITYADAASLAWHFGVSYAAAVWRLRGLNLVNQEQAQALLEQTEEAHRYRRAVRARSDEEDSIDETPWDHELNGQILSLALEAWWRGEITRDRLLEVGRLLNIDDETILDLAG